MTRAKGAIQEVSIRIVGAAMVAVALYGCSQSGQSSTTADAALATSTQNAEMAEVVISTSRPPRPRG